MRKCMLVSIYFIKVESVLTLLLKVLRYHMFWCMFSASLKMCNTKSMSVIRLDRFYSYMYIL